MSDSLLERISAIYVLADGSILDGHTRIAAWPTLRIGPIRTLQLTQQIIWAQPGDKLWEYTQRIPRTIMGLVRTAPTYQWELLELAAAEPERGCELIRQCPALAILIARSCPPTLPERAAYFCRVLNSTWREMLDVIGLPQKARFVRLLRKIPMLHCTDKTLDAVIDAVRTKHPYIRVLFHLKRITRDTGELITLPARLINPHLLLASALSGYDEAPICAMVHAVAWYLEIEEPGRSWPYGRLAADQLKAVESRYRDRNTANGDAFAPFPPPPFPGIPGRITPLRDFWALAAEGHEQGNCAENYVSEVRDGHCYFYSVTGPERATLMIRRVGDSAKWVIGELRDEDNAPASAATTEFVLQWLRQN